MRILVLLALCLALLCPAANGQAKRKPKPLPPELAELKALAKELEGLPVLKAADVYLKTDDDLVKEWEGKKVIVIGRLNTYSEDRVKDKYSYEVRLYSQIPMKEVRPVSVMLKVNIYFSENMVALRQLQDEAAKRSLGVDMAIVGKVTQANRSKVRGFMIEDAKLIRAVPAK